jgi:hypothetical protein
MALFIKKAAQSKLPKNMIATNGPVKLIDLQESCGVLSDTCISSLMSGVCLNNNMHFMPYKKYPVDKKNETFWHFDSEMAKAWIEFFRKK